MVDAVKATGREKLIIAGLEAHDMAVRRMIQAGVVPMTWVAFAWETQLLNTPAPTTGARAQQRQEKR
ncbi:hypothetical protein [Amycolatopsis sp. lyj-84]|uniref:hypothetical protein n=1 Tax=Amycolatopsis sp. lyj-84 TaxID=2789284 RepID=UPI00397BF23C